MMYPLKINISLYNFLDQEIQHTFSCGPRFNHVVTRLHCDKVTLLWSVYTKSVTNFRYEVPKNTGNILSDLVHTNSVHCRRQCSFLISIYKQETSQKSVVLASSAKPRLGSQFGNLDLVVVWLKIHEPQTQSESIYLNNL